MQVDKLAGNPKPLDILTKINQIIDNMVVSVNGSGAEDGNINVVTIPVGFIYVQFAGQSAPAELFGGTWENISAQYAGRFFRAEGGSAASFGNDQGGGIPDASGTVWGTTGWNGGVGGNGVFSTYNGNMHTAADRGTVFGSVDFNMYLSRANKLYGAAGEVRPINSTIRIWKRTA